MSAESAHILRKEKKKYAPSWQLQQQNQMTQAPAGKRKTIIINPREERMKKSRIVSAYATEQNSGKGEMFTLNWLCR